MSLSNAQKGIIQRYRQAMELGEFEYRETLTWAAGVQSTRDETLGNPEFIKIMLEMEKRLNSLMVDGRMSSGETFEKIPDPWRWHRQVWSDQKCLHSMGRAEVRAKEVRNSDPYRQRAPKKGKPATSRQVAKIRAILHDLSHFERDVKEWSYLAAMLTKSKRFHPAEIPTGWDTLDTLAAKLLIDILKARYDQALRAADRAAEADEIHANTPVDLSVAEVDYSDPCPF